MFDRGTLKWIQIVCDADKCETDEFYKNARRMFTIGNAATDYEILENYFEKGGG